MKNLVIGFGTGRCGTTSLCDFLNQQPGFNITHEKINVGWELSHSDPTGEIATMFDREGHTVGDIAYIWVKHIWEVMRYQPKTKLINLHRPTEEVLESFWDLRQNDKHCGNPRWFSWPVDSNTFTKDDIARSLVKYREMELVIKRAYPFSIYWMKMADLNDEAILAEMLGWLGFCESEYVLTPVHAWKRAEAGVRKIDPERSIRPSFMDQLPDNMKISPPSDVSEV